MLSVIPTNLQSQSWFESLSFPRFFNLLNILSSTPTRPQIYIHASCLNGLSSSTALNLLPATCWQRCSRLQLMPLSFKILAVSTCYHKEKKIKKGLIKMKKKSIATFQLQYCLFRHYVLCYYTVEKIVWQGRKYGRSLSELSDSAFITKSIVNRRKLMGKHSQLNYS